MHHPKQNKPNKSSLKTVSGWATELKRDRRTIAAKLKTAAPEGKVNGFPVYSLGAVLKALQPPPGEGATLRDAKLAQEIRKLKLYNDKRDGLLVEKELVKQSINRFNTRVDAYLVQLENEWPSLLCGLEAPAIRAYLKRGTDSIRQEISDSYREWLC
jgi:hypothetical protein